MNAADMDVVLAHFDDRLDRFETDDPRALSWGSRASQLSRFAVLAEVGHWNGRSVLDVGCGVGDLFAYLYAENKAAARYLGIDIHPRMIERARRKYPGVAFEVRDLLREPLPEAAFDYVVASGIFNLATPSWHDVAYRMLKAMYDTCRLAMAVNFLSRLSGNSQPESYYADPVEVTRFVTASLSRRFVLRHDYRDNDFTLFVYRGGTGTT